MGFDSDKGTRLGVLHTAVTVDLPAARPAFLSIGAQVSFQALARLGALVFRIDSVFKQGPAVTGVRRIIQPAVCRQPDADAAFLTQFDQVEQFPCPP